MPKQEMKTLTSLRFFAALLVVATHGLPFWLGADYLQLPRALRHLTDVGVIAVPFFFVLSGFVLIFTYPDLGMRGLKRFWAHRVARLVPLYFLALVVAVSAVQGRPERPMPVLQAVMVNTFFLQAWIPASLFLNFSSWSLSAEVFFYLLFPALAAATKRCNARACLGAMLLLYAVLFLTWILIVRNWPGLSTWPWTYSALDPKLCFFLEKSPLVHLGEFFFGILLGRFFLGGEKARRYGDGLLLAGLVGGFFLLELAPGMPFLALNSFFLLPCFAAVVLGGSQARGPLLKWLEHPALVALGDASYGIYLLHLPLQLLADRIAWRIFLTPWEMFFLFTALFLTGCVALFRFFEAPARGWIRKKLA